METDIYEELKETYGIDVHKLDMMGFSMCVVENNILRIRKCRGFSEKELEYIREYPNLIDIETDTSEPPLVMGFAYLEPIKIKVVEPDKRCKILEKEQ